MPTCSYVYSKPNADGCFQIIYCGGARFKNILDTRPGAAPNTQAFADSVHYFEAGDFYDRCFNKNDIEMYTSTAPDDSIQKPSVVQICPWYVPARAPGVHL